MERWWNVGRIRITSRVDVAAPPAAAWAVVADFARNPEWQRGMRSCRWLDPPPTRVGSRYAQEARFLGRTITTVFEVVAREEREDGGGTISIASVDSTFPLAVTRSVTAAPGGCRVDADVSGRPDGILGWLDPLTTRLVQRSVDGDYRRLRALLEAGRGGEPA